MRWVFLISNANKVLYGRKETVFHDFLMLLDYRITACSKHHDERKHERLSIVIGAVGGVDPANWVTTTEYGSAFSQLCPVAVIGTRQVEVIRINDGRNVPKNEPSPYLCGTGVLFLCISVNGWYQFLMRDTVILVGVACRI